MIDYQQEIDHLYSIGNDSDQKEVIDQLCIPVQVAAPDMVDEPVVQTTLGFFYALIWFCGVLGNITVLYVVILRRVEFSVRTVFIISLACSDLLMGFTSLPVTAVTTFR